MPASFADCFATLTSFSPARVSLRGAPWEQLVPWLVEQGLAPIAAYNLEYRLGGAGAPEWVRERLLGLYQGSLNDNVMKLVNFKRSIDDLEGRRVVGVGGVSFADALYPHIAFRPVIDVRLMLPPADLDGLVGFLKNADFKPGPVPPDGLPAERLVTDGRTEIFLHGSMVGSPALDAELLARARPMKVYGPSMYRFEPEDALLVQVLMHQRQRWLVPMLEQLDVRELVLGAPSLGGPYSRALDAAVLHQRAAAWGLTRALYVALQVVGRLFPIVAGVAGQLTPALEPSVKAALDERVVGQLSVPGAPADLPAPDELRRLLAA